MTNNPAIPQAQTALKYHDVASEIIRKSINSVMFIDDDLSEPFAIDIKGVDLSKGIYESFKNEGCSVDFYKFQNYENWQKKSHYTLASRDMLILDWQLSKTPPEHSPTLAIISEAVKRNNLHFLCIYTETEISSFPNIIYDINSYFSKFDLQEIENDISSLTQSLSDEGFNFSEVFTQEVSGLLKEMVLDRKNSGKTFAIAKSKLEANSNKEASKKILDHLLQRIKDGVYPSLPYSFCAIGIKLNNAAIEIEKTINPKEIRNYVSDNFLIVNHTIILITNKKEIKPNDLYKKFKEALISDSGNFLTLMGLEMRNLFRESSSFIGKDIDSINELAFFHHKDKSIPSEAFYDFLRELWKSQSSSFLYNDANQPKIFGVLEDYKSTNEIDKKMEEFLSSSTQYEQPLSKLNYYYNILRTDRKINDQIRFGDIFKLTSEKSEDMHQYLLCITAHCDCLYAKDKINNMFYFVKGSKGNLESALKEGDTAFNSYIANNNSIEVINWFTKPFTLFIPEDRNNISQDIEITLGNDKKVLKFHSTLKENYAQRIANSAFIYPLHVGIFYADTKSLAKGEK